MSLRSLHQLLVSLALFVCTSAFAAPLVIDVTGTSSTGLYTDPANTVLTFDVGANATVTGLSFSINLSTFDTSFLSEIGLAVSDSGGTSGFFFRPAFADERPGTASYADAYDLVQLGLDFDVGADGILRLEFFEDDDDVAGADARWNFGTLTFEVEGGTLPEQPGDVPEPGSVLLLAAGLGAMAYAGRRRALARRA